MGEKIGLGECLFSITWDEIFSKYSLHRSYSTFFGKKINSKSRFFYISKVISSFICMQNTSQNIHSQNTGFFQSMSVGDGVTIVRMQYV